MFVMVVGGGRVGSQLTRDLLAHGHKVRLVEMRPNVLAHLHREVPTEAIYDGDPTHPEVLENAGIRKAQVLAAVWGSDSTNLAVASFGRTLFDVPRIVARVNDPRYAWLFTPEMGVDVAINHSDIIVSLIQEEMSLGDMMTLAKLRRGAFSLVEEKIPAGAQAVGVAIKDLDIPENCVIAGIIRAGKLVVPRGITELQVADEVLAVTDEEGAEKLATLFAKPGS